MGLLIRLFGFCHLLRFDPFPNPVSAGMDDGVFNVHTKLFDRGVESPDSVEGDEDPIAVREANSPPPTPVKISIPQLSFGSTAVLSGTKDSPTAKSAPMLPTLNGIRSPEARAARESCPAVVIDILLR